MKNKKNITKINFSILSIGSISAIISTFIFANTIAVNQYNTPFWINNIVALFFSIGSITGMISVYYSNRKSLQFFFYGMIATLFKLSYPIIQIVVGQPAINASVIMGQFATLFYGLFQFVNWKKLNKIEENANKFKTKYFDEHGKTQALLLLMGYAVFWLIVSVFIQLGNGLDYHKAIFFALLDTIGAVSFTFGSIWMGMGNIWGFFGFLVSDITWIGWTINDIVHASSPLMISMAIATLIQVTAYTGFAITGYYEWKLE